MGLASAAVGGAAPPPTDPAAAFAAAAAAAFGEGGWADVGPPEAPRGVRKRVLRAGPTGAAPPPRHARCRAAVEGWWWRPAAAADDDDEKDVAEGPRRLGDGDGAAEAVLVAGRDAEPRGLHRGVGTMRPGEVCELVCAAEFGYGAAGRFSFPAVPPGAALLYRVELVAWSPVDEARPKGELLFEERCEAAGRRREAGNAAFRAGELAVSAHEYELGLDFVDEEMLLQLYADRHREAALRERLPLLLNLATVCLKRGAEGRAAALAEEVLADAANAKAHFVRGRALRRLGRLDEARAALGRAQAAAPGDPAVGRELEAVARERQREERAQGALYRRMFAAEDGGEDEAGAAEADGREAGCWRRLLELVGRLVGARWGGKGKTV